LPNQYYIMQKQTALKFLYLHRNMDDDDLQVINKLHNRIKKNQMLNGGLWVSDWRTSSSHRWKGVGMAEFARRLGMSAQMLNKFVLHINWHDVMEELADKYHIDLEQYQSDVDIDEVLSWALKLLADDHSLRGHRLHREKA